MAVQPIPLIINPTAGRGRAGKRLPAIKKCLDDAGVGVDIRASRAMGDVEAQVAQAIDEGAERIIVAGGDGSIHEACNGLMKAKGSAAIGLIPTGTGNDFAKAAAIPLDWEAATRLLADRLSSNALARSVDLGRVNDRYFANGAGIGFDAKVSRMARSLNWPIGDLVYLFAVFRAMVDGIITPHVTIVGDKFNWDGPLTLANISNGPWVGGLFHIAPMADQADGNLDLVIAAPVTFAQIMALLPKLMRGKHIGDARITHAPVRQLHIKASAPVPSHLDGEVQDLGTDFDIEIIPGALRLL
jgi:diacylglycerol kinase (ATP)